MKAFPGTYRVEITGSKVVGQKKFYDSADSPMDDVLESFVPAEYNSESKLEWDVNLDTKTLDLKLVTPSGRCVGRHPAQEWSIIQARRISEWYAATGRASRFSSPRSRPCCGSPRLPDEIGRWPSGDRLHRRRTMGSDRPPRGAGDENRRFDRPVPEPSKGILASAVTALAGLGWMRRHRLVRPSSQLPSRFNP
jgi:hypothetical protein